MKLSGLALVIASAGWAQADWQFRSRPDLSPPRLNITIPATDDVSPGFIFVTPYPRFDAGAKLPEQPAAYIFRSNGDLIWSSLGYFSGFVANFQAAQYQGKPVLQAFQGIIDGRHGHGFGSPLLLDKEYKPVAQLQSLTHKLVSVHEYRIVYEKTVLVEIYQPTPYDLTPYGGSEEQQWIVDAIFQEIDIETGELLFEARSLDFASPDNSVTPLQPNDALNATDAWDYFHLNSVDKDSDGNYLISGRHTSTLYKISGRDGSVIWQLGGEKSTFSLPGELDFGYQHDTRFLNRTEDGKIEVISLFDNSAGTVRPSEERIALHPNSRGLIVQLNHTDNSSTILQSYDAPDHLSAESQGNTQVLPNGNVFINWGQEGAVTEFRADGTPIFHAYLDTGAGVQSYRGFRYEWTGYSREIPAIVALKGKHDTTVYVSWNGDTEVAVWRFYTQATDGFKTKRLGEVKRKSFETSLKVSAEALEYKGQEGLLFAEGVDRHGRILTRSPVVTAKEAIQPISKKVEKSEEAGEIGEEL
ncbi:Fc.00g031500.m01.CDS01 [Cosmosporella sp. VM-42]